MLSSHKQRIELRIIKVLHFISVLMLLVLGVSISVDTFYNTSNLTGAIYLKIQFWVCIYFLVSLFIEFLFSKDKLRFFRKNFLFILISIPYINIFDHYGIVFSPEVRYFFRFIPLIRGGYALGFVVMMLSTRKVSGLFFSYILILIALVYFYSLIFYVFEYKVNSGVNTYFDALWWASMEATTAGSSIVAVTPVGKVLSVVTAVSGLTMFPFFTVYITSLVQKIDIFQKNKAKQKDEASN